MQRGKNNPKLIPTSLLNFSKIEESFIVNSVSNFENQTTEKVHITDVKMINNPSQRNDHLILKSPEINDSLKNMYPSSTSKSLARTIIFNEFDNNDLNDEDDEFLQKKNNSINPILTLNLDLNPFNSFKKFQRENFPKKQDNNFNFNLNFNQTQNFNQIRNTIKNKGHFIPFNNLNKSKCLNRFSLLKNELDYNNRNKANIFPNERFSNPNLKSENIIEKLIKENPVKKMISGNQQEDNDENVVKSLNFINYKIEQIPKIEANFELLQELLLDHNLISNIPAEIKVLKKLEKLTLSFNLIKTIPVEVSQLLNLSILIINNNCITEIPNDLCGLPLTVFYFHENQISFLPSKFYLLTKLKEISFDWFFYIPPYSIKLIMEIDGHKTLFKLFELIKNMENHLSNEKCDFILVLSAFYKKEFSEIINYPLFANGRALIHRAAIQGNVEVLNCLIKNKCDVNKKDDTECTALILSLKANNLNIAKRLLELEDCDINLSSPKYSCPLLISLVKHKYDIALTIVNNKTVNVNCVDNEKNNPLHMLFAQFDESNKKFEEMCNILIEKKCDVNFKNCNLLTPLYQAIKKGQKAAIMFALKYNKSSPIFNFNEKCGKYEWTSLHYAVIYADVEIIKEILKSNVNVFSVDKSNKSARNLALIGSIKCKLVFIEEKKRLVRMYKNYISLRKFTSLPITIIDFGLDKLKKAPRKGEYILDVSEGENEARIQIDKYNNNSNKKEFPHIESIANNFLKKKISTNMGNYYKLEGKINQIAPNVLSNSIQFFQNMGNPLTASGSHHFNNLNLSNAGISNTKEIEIQVKNAINLDKIVPNFLTNISLFNKTNAYINKPFYERHSINNCNCNEEISDILRTEETIDNALIKKNIFSNYFSQIMNKEIMYWKKLGLLYKIFKINLLDSFEILKIIQKNSKGSIHDYSSYLINLICINNYTSIPLGNCNNLQTITIKTLKSTKHEYWKNNKLTTTLKIPKKYTLHKK